MPSPRPLGLLAVVTLAVGVFAAAVADFFLYAYDDSCPQWAGEGPMAAPGSPYSAIMCGPGAEPPFTWAVYGGAALTGVLLWVARRRSTSVRRVLPWLALGLVLPTLVVGLLHLTLPQDCLSGETSTSDCLHDREMRLE